MTAVGPSTQEQESSSHLSIATGDKNKIVHGKKKATFARKNAVHLLSTPSESDAQPVFGTHAIWGDDIEVVYALPKNTNNLKGIVLLLHACTHNALKFFSPNDSCPSCLGLSEELRIVRLVLSRGYAALAVTCHNTKSGCWSDADLPRLDVALDTFQTQILPTTIPKNHIIAIGASSGGHMAAKVVAEGKAASAKLRRPVQTLRV